MRPCTKCGKKPEHNGREWVATHHLGCRALRRPAPEPEQGALPEVESCAREDCGAPRAESKGPRPAKYCEKHKTSKGKQR